jgi:hypothetical protein
MHPSNQIQAGYIILTEYSGSKPYKVAINPSQISSICDISCYGGCSARVYMCGRDQPYDTTEAFDEILELIEDYNKQHNTSNYE